MINLRIFCDQIFGQKNMCIKVSKYSSRRNLSNDIWVEWVELGKVNEKRLRGSNQIETTLSALFNLLSLFLL